MTINKILGFLIAMVGITFLYSCENEDLSIAEEYGQVASQNRGLTLDDLGPESMELLQKKDSRFSAISNHESALMSRSLDTQTSKLIEHFLGHFYSENNLIAFLKKNGTPQWSHYLDGKENYSQNATIVPISLNGEWNSSLLFFSDQDGLIQGAIDFVTNEHMANPTRYLKYKPDSETLTQISAYVQLKMSMHFALYGEIDQEYINFFSNLEEQKNTLSRSKSGLTSRCVGIRICQWVGTDPDAPIVPIAFQIPVSSLPTALVSNTLESRVWNCYTIYDCGDPIFGTQDYDFGFGGDYGGSHGGSNDGGGGGGSSGGGGGASSSVDTPEMPNICMFTGGVVDGGFGSDPEMPASILDALEKQALRDAADAYIRCNGIDPNSDFGQFLTENYEFTAQLQAINAGPGSEEEKALATFDLYMTNPILVAEDVGAILQEFFILRTLAENSNESYWDLSQLVAQAFWNVYSDRTHTLLDIVGLVPGIGEPADLLNGAIYVLEGDVTNATLSFAAIVPVAGSVGTAGRVVNRVFQVVKRADGKIFHNVFKRIDDVIEFCANGGTGCRGDLREILGGVTGDGKHAHHMLPVSVMGHPVIQRVARGGNFHMNDPVNGILIPAANHLPGHSGYNTVIQNALTQGDQLGMLGNDIIDEILVATRRHFSNGGTAANFAFSF